MAQPRVPITERIQRLYDARDQTDITDAIANRGHQENRAGLSKEALAYQELGNIIAAIQGKAQMISLGYAARETLGIPAQEISGVIATIEQIGQAYNLDLESFSIPFSTVKSTLLSLDR